VNCQVVTITSISHVVAFVRPSTARCPCSASWRSARAWSTARRPHDEFRKTSPSTTAMALTLPCAGCRDRRLLPSGDPGRTLCTTKLTKPGLLCTTKRTKPGLWRYPTPPGPPGSVHPARDKPRQPPTPGRLPGVGRVRDGIPTSPATMIRPTETVGLIIVKLADCHVHTCPELADVRLSTDRCRGQAISLVLNIG
jgi:hypothetical protein